VREETTEEEGRREIRATNKQQNKQNRTEQKGEKNRTERRQDNTRVPVIERVIGTFLHNFEEFIRRNLTCYGMRMKRRKRRKRERRQEERKEGGESE
jgi:hypothetical protein